MKNRRGNGFNLRPGGRILSVLPAFLFVLALAFAGAQTAHAGEPFMKSLLPERQCAKGWPIEGEIRLFDQKNLFDHIDGEAELYFPYGFEMLAAAVYIKAGNPDAAVTADVYRMGSLLDAFGIYSGYRKPDSESIAIGADGFISPTQLMFYQDRYFVRIQASGTDLSRSLFLSCAKAIAGKLPAGPKKPRELDWLKVPGLIPRSERYIAKSLLGYDFFGRGMTADVRLQGETIQIFIVPEESAAAARRSFDRYRRHLQDSGKIDPKDAADQKSNFLYGSDPLYGGAVLEQSGRFLIGAVRMKDPASAAGIIEMLSKNLPAH